MNTTPSPAELLWQVHRAVLGGKSSATGHPLPIDLASAPPGAQAAHHALACFEAFRRDEPIPARPEFLAVDLAELAELVAQTHAVQIAPPKAPDGSRREQGTD